MQHNALDDHGSRLSRNLSISLRGAQSDHLIRTSDDLKVFSILACTVCDSFQEGRMVASEIHKGVGYPSEDQRLEEDV